MNNSTSKDKAIRLFHILGDIGEDILAEVDVTEIVSLAAKTATRKRLVKGAVTAGAIGLASAGITMAYWLLHRRNKLKLA